MSLHNVTVTASQAHTATVIFIHGLGQSNLTWQTLVLESLAPMLPHVKWILPQAIDRPVSLDNGKRGPSWFDIARLPPGNDEYDEVSIAESIAAVENLILDQVHSGIDSHRIALVGFSQGAATSMMSALSSLHELAGVASLSGWIPHRARDMTHAAAALPILWCHGTADDRIPLEYGKDAVSFLTGAAGISEEMVTFKIYEGLAHTTNATEINDLGIWLKTILGSN